MMNAFESYDVAVVGGGPVGAAAAIAFAHQGASVALLEADPRAARRFAGEWIHPPGVAVLEWLCKKELENTNPCRGTGFVIFGDDGGDPVRLPYASGNAMALEHERIVEVLREAAGGFKGVHYLSGHRVVSVQGRNLVVERKPGKIRHEIRAERVLGADGRSSIVRRCSGFEENSTPLSYMASAELRGVELPFEGMGHVVLGGPGPVLLYRIDAERIRACLDVPCQSLPAGAGAQFLWKSFGSVLPRQLRGSFRQALERGPVRWANNRFRPRTDFGVENIWLVGDAVGHVHPLTAIGLTVGLLDVACAARTTSLKEYAAERQSYVPELLANALYAVFSQKDKSALSMRRALLELLRGSESQRKCTMGILMGDAEGALDFARAFLRTAGGAAEARLSEVVAQGRWLAIPSALFDNARWLEWPSAAVLPRPFRDPWRRRSSPSSPWRKAVRIPLNGARPIKIEAFGRDSMIDPAWVRTPERMTALKNNSSSDWEWCERTLRDVSRTFSEPIRLLPEELGRALTLGYLLCRVADTIEDLPNLGREQRSEMFAVFLQVLEGRCSASELERYFQADSASPEMELACNVSTVLRVFDQQPEQFHGPTRRWVGEMTHGMRLYTERPTGPDGIIALYTLEDLERYCYFVAGTVGHLVTDLFVSHLGERSPSRLESELREHAEAFGIGLQLVNILKDVTDDFECNKSYIPRSLSAAQGLSLPDLFDPAHRRAAHAVVAPIFTRARAHLDRALTYTLAVPEKQDKLRLFCLLPLWMAVRTLMLARGNDDMFTPLRPVKISRQEVAQIIAECTRHARDDAVLRGRYARLWSEPHETFEAQRSVG